MTSFSGTDLTCIRGETLVFSGLNFDCNAGGALLLVGPNGSGKSSLLRILAGLLKPAAGRVAWNDDNVFDEPHEHHARLAYLGHQDAVKPVLTVYENIAFWAHLRAKPAIAEKRIDAAMSHYAIDSLRDIPGRFLSAGQARRTNLARLMAIGAPLWLLDEPATALDRATVTALEDALFAHRAGGGTVIASTHQDINLPEARTLDLAAFSKRRTARP